MAAPAELASVPVNEIIKSIRLNGQAMRLGEAVYVRRCASCHGPNLKGLPDQHTPDLTDETLRFSGDDLKSAGATLLPSDVEWTVRYGVRSGHPYSRGNDSPMLALDPAFRSEKDKADFGSDAFLSAAEIEDMVEYVLQLSGQPHDIAGARRVLSDAADAAAREGRGSITIEFFLLSLLRDRSIGPEVADALSGAGADATAIESSLAWQVMDDLHLLFGEQGHGGDALRSVLSSGAVRIRTEDFPIPTGFAAYACDIHTLTQARSKASRWKPPSNSSPTAAARLSVSPRPIDSKASARSSCARKAMP